MKKLLFGAICLFSLNLGATAQKTKSKKASTTKAKGISIPTAVKSAFMEMYSTIENAKWSRTAAGSYTASFRDEEFLNNTSVEYNNDGDVTKAVSLYDKEGVPAIVPESVETKYSNANIDAVRKIDIPGIPVYYDVQITTADSKKRSLVVSPEGMVTM